MDEKLRLISDQNYRPALVPLTLYNHQNNCRARKTILCSRNSIINQNWLTPFLETQLQLCSWVICLLIINSTIDEDQITRWTCTIKYIISMYVCSCVCVFLMCWLDGIALVYDYKYSETTILRYGKWKYRTIFKGMRPKWHTKLLDVGRIRNEVNTIPQDP